ncbi:MAG: helix-turn-helix transcriptional regulator [Candidatus Gastranaerophilales bacterium]|nr:helix-turn-helix transcriptional regulator [Candidatus Gastranaerophilales bacterium]
MAIVTKKIDKILRNKNLSRYKLSKLIDYRENTLNHMIRGEQSFSDTVKERILPILEVSIEEFEGWILADKYSKEIIKMAINTKLDRSSRRSLTAPQDDIELILTAKIDEILQNKNISRTQLSKLIKHDQSTLNRMITGKETMSKSVISRIAIALEITENEIKSWILAGKYSLKTLKTALLNTNKAVN